MALSLAYGIQIKPIDDPFIDLAESAMNSATTAASVGAFLVDVIPILKFVPEFVPGAGFQKKARMWRKIQEDFRERPYLASIKAMVIGTTCFNYDHKLIRLLRPPARLALH